VNAHSLSGAWEFRNRGEGAWRQGTVPGCVHTDLLALGEIPDPFVRDQDLRVGWVAERAWTYRTRFVLPPKLQREERLFLVADGVDTLANVELNGRMLGRVDNQYRRWEWEIGRHLEDEENVLVVHFDSPVREAAARQAVRPMTTVVDQLPGAPHLRKAPYHFGWDWGPQLPTVGVWKDVRIEGHSIARLADVHLRQEHADGKARIRAAVEVDRWTDGDLAIGLRVIDPHGAPAGETTATLHGDAGELVLTIDDPQLWWPNGYGDQPLYTVAVGLCADGRDLDSRAFQLGLRTIELDRTPDTWGERFRFVANGVSIFAQGANWIPPDTFAPRISPARLERRVRDAAAVHQNMLRIWGGGTYGDERLYDLCDRYGILVWQDFAFSCSVYPLDEAGFVDSVRAEVEDNVRRIRHRACLALLCGNNEMNQGWEAWGWSKHQGEDELIAAAQRIPALQALATPPDETTRLPDWEVLRDAYRRFFYTTLPDWLSDLAPDVAYWASSPSSGAMDAPVNDPARGDAHFWDVWHGRKPFSAFREFTPRFMSEFGFQAFPTMSTIEAYADPEDRNLTSAVMEHHQRGNHGNGLIIAQMADHFRMPTSFAGWIYLSHVLQAEGIRIGVEHWRRNRERVGGVLYWQLDDCWPVASWSSIDYYGRWKALHYAARRFYAPVLLSTIEEDGDVALHVTNDRLQPVTVDVRWTVETLHGDAVVAGGRTVTVPPQADASVATVEVANCVAEHGRDGCILVCECSEGGARPSLTVHPLVASKHLDLKEPEIQTSVSVDGSQLSIVLRATSLARFVEVALDGLPDTVFSDNGFDLPAHRDVAVTCDVPSDWDRERAVAALRVYSLFDSYAPRYD